MDDIEVIAALAALAQSTRLHTFRLLVAREPEGVPAGELARLVEVPPNTMSAHLAILARAKLIIGERRSRSIIYRANLDRFRELALFLLKDCCGGHPEPAALRSSPILPLAAHLRRLLMAERIFNVLFLCTGNSARSILAEPILRKEGAGRFRAFSAGSHPRGAVNPFCPSRSLRCLRSIRPTGFRWSKSWDEFAGASSGAPVMDFVFTVCDTAAAETCPIWPGQPMTAHWGIEDPAAVEGTDIQKEAAFVLAARYLKNRISIFTNLPIRSLDKLSLNAKLREIGHLDGATKPRPEVA